MAITRAQQAKQMLRKGGRIGLRGGGADMSTVSAADIGIGTSTDKREYSPSEKAEQRATQRLNERIEQNRQERERQKLRQELLMTPIGRNRPLGPLSRFNANVQRNMNIKLAKKRYDDLISRLDDYVVGDTDMDYDFSGAPVGLATLTSNKGTSAESTRPNLYTVNPKTSVSALQTLLSATRPDTQVTLQNTLDKAKDYRNLVADAENMTNQEIKDALTELQNRGKTPDQINPVRDDDGPEPIIPINTTFAETPVDEEDYYASVGGNPFTGEGLRLAFRADGGRIGLQEGGGIEQRLEKLGGDVSSAEKMLQGINQRLKTAESSLGSGGGIGGLPAPEPQGFSSFEEMMKLRTTQDIPNFYYDLEGVRRDPQGNLFTPKPGQLPTTITRPRPGIGAINFLQSPQQDPYKGTILGGLSQDGQRFDSAQSAFDALAEKTRKQREITPFTRNVIGTELFRGAEGFKRFTDLFNKINDPGFVAPSPQLLSAQVSSGIPAIGLAEGGDVEPVAKKTMPLLDLKGQEMDLRDNGGFVPIGRMEKADDVPARLSKNEFVFTADAVRNAGDGDIDKGAEVMYNMMKNLEDGGNVSEESQGLEGARNMFQTAQRLEEVL